MVPGEVSHEAKTEAVQRVVQDREFIGPRVAKEVEAMEIVFGFVGILLGIAVLLAVFNISSQTLRTANQLVAVNSKLQAALDHLGVDYQSCAKCAKGGKKVRLEVTRAGELYCPECGTKRQV